MNNLNIDIEMLELEKVLIDKGEDTAFLTELKMSYMEKYGILIEKKFNKISYEYFLKDYIDHLKDIIEIKYGKEKEDEL